MAIRDGMFRKMPVIDENLMRLYNPQQFMANFPQMPQAPAAPEPVLLPTTDPQVRGGGGNRPDNFVTPDFNPNLLGQYFGYNNLNFPTAPGQNQPSPNDPRGYNPDFNSPVLQENFGIMNLLQASPTFRFFTQAVPEIVGNVAEGIQKIFQQQDQSADSGGGTFVENTLAAIDRAANEQAATTREDYRTQQDNRVSNAQRQRNRQKQKEKDAKALGRTRGETGRFNFGGR